LALTQTGIARGRMLQLAAYMLTIALFAVAIALWRNWRNDRVGYWLNLSVVTWADIIWVLVVVLPGYVRLARGLIPPAFWLAGYLCSTLAQRHRADRLSSRQALR
jgi:O-antigen/teichoic acid export membrane protein